MKTMTSVSNALITAILDGLPLAREEHARILARSELDPAAVRDVNERTSILAFARFWSEVLHATSDDFVGLEIGRRVSGSRFGLASRVAANSEDLRQLFARLAHFAPLINELMVCRLEETRPLARFSMKLAWDASGLERHAVDIAFAAIVRELRRRIGARFVLREVRLRHGLACARDRYEALFSVPIVFKSESSALVFEAEALDLPVGEADPELGTILERYARAEIADAPVLSDLPSRVSQVLLRELGRGQPVDLPRVCGELRTPPRQLQRGLHVHATTFSALLEDARRSLAPKLLTEDAANVEQVGFQLGYAEPTAFIRAFKKWYRMTPGEYRKRTRGPARGAVT